MFRNITKRTVKRPEDGYVPPFRLCGNVYFVGTWQASAHLIDTGEGLIMIDTGYENTLYLVIDAIHRLGFDPRDVKYIVNTHWHHDHVCGTAALAALSGAKTLIGHADAENAKKYFAPDILVHEGDTLSLGNTVLHFLETPGHTAGTLSLFFEVTEGEKRYRLGMFGGAGINTLAKDTLEYPNARADYFTSIARLRDERVDVMLGNHTWNNNTAAYGKLLLEGGENRFLDPTMWEKFLLFCEGRLCALIAKENT